MEDDRRCSDSRQQRSCKSGINSNTTLGLSPEVVALSSRTSPRESVTAWSPGFSHLRTTHLHLYSYLDGYHSILSWTLLSEDGISLSVLLPNSTASSLGSHLGTTASSPFGLSPRASQHHLLGSHEHATSASFGFLPV